MWRSSVGHIPAPSPAAAYFKRPDTSSNAGADRAAATARALALLCCVQAAGELQRRWRDGSLEEDLPMRGLSEMFNVSEGCLGNIPRGA